MDPALWELLASGTATDEVEAIIRLDGPGQLVPGVRIVSRFGPVATCRLKRGAVMVARRHLAVVSLKAPRLLGPEMPGDAAGIPSLPLAAIDTDVRRPPGLRATGAGTVVGLADWGCDVAHADFRRRDGSTRLLALWDQRGPSVRHVGNPYGYGTIHGRRSIDQALRSGSPYRALGYHPADADPTGFGSHGTHVLSIAAGNGRGGGPLGVAPAADLCFVHLADRGTGGLANLGDSVRILEAVDFVARVAGQRPWVLNLSVGRHGGSHDGRSLVEMAFDYALSAAPGRCIVQSTGNYYDKRVHAGGRLRVGETHPLTIIVDEADVTPNELEVWYPGADALAVCLESPDGTRSEWTRLGERTEVLQSGAVVGRIYNRARDPNNLDNHVDAFLFPNAMPGRWTVLVRGDRVLDGSYHAWLERDQACPGCQTRFDAGDADPAYTTGTLANGRLPLTVGAYDAHSPGREIAPFSSAGPTRDCRPKPDLVAPGIDVLAARSADRSGSSHIGLVRKSGTSMAAPHVTGVVALCFASAGRPLWSHEIRALVLENATPVATRGEGWSRFGHGYLDVACAVRAAARLSRDERRRRRAPARTAPVYVPEDLMSQHEREPKFGQRSSSGSLDRAGAFDPRALYRDIAYRGGETDLVCSIAGAYSVLGRPGRRPVSRPEAGDLLVRVALGEPGLARASVLADGDLWHHTQLWRAPFKPEGRQPGFYGVVEEDPDRGDGLSEGLGRLLLDPQGRIPMGQLILHRLEKGTDADAESESFDVRYAVQLVPQQTGMSCWAAGAAMLVAWRDRMSIDPAEIARAAGYWAQYRHGLHPEDTTVFRVWGLTPEPAQTYSVDGFRQLLQTFGPLWVASAEPGAHVRVVTGLAGDGTADGTTVYINDPWDRGKQHFTLPNTGSVYTETYRQFVEKQATLGRREHRFRNAIYVAHLEQAGIERVVRSESEQAGEVTTATLGGSSVTAAPQRPHVPRTTVCGFHVAGSVLTEANLGRAIASAATLERRKWLVGTVFQKEGDPARFPDLIRYWLASDRSIANDAVVAAQQGAVVSGMNYDAIRTNKDAVKAFEEADHVFEQRKDWLLYCSDQVDAAPSDKRRQAEQQLRRARKDRDAAGEERKRREAAAQKIDLGTVPDELVDAAAKWGMAVIAQSTARKALRQAHNSAHEIAAWSAVFVSSCVRGVAIAEKLEARADVLLKPSARHLDYVVEAWKRKNAHVSGTYHAHAPQEHPVRVGDIIVTDRRLEISRPISLQELADVATRKDTRELHGDIVIDVTTVGTTVGPARIAETIGGNLGNTVRRRRYPLDGSGCLVVARERLYAQEKDDATFDDFVTRSIKPTTLPRNSTGRIFAVLRLVGECKVADATPELERSANSSEQVSDPAEGMTGEEAEPYTPRSKAVEESFEHQELDTEDLDHGTLEGEDPYGLVPRLQTASPDSTPLDEGASTASCEIVLQTRDAEATVAGRLRWAWVYWKEDGNVRLLRTDGTGRVLASPPGADRTAPWVYMERFVKNSGTQTDLYFSRGARPIPDAILMANPAVFHRRTVSATGTHVGTLAQRTPVSALITLPNVRIELTRPTELSFWPLLWEPHSDAYHTTGLNQGAALWANPAGGGGLTIVENHVAPLPPAAIRPRERALKVEGIIDAAVTGATIQVLDATGRPLQLREATGGPAAVPAVSAALDPAVGDTRRFEASLFLVDAVAGFGPVQILLKSKGVAPPLIEAFTVHCCGLQIALVDDHTANQNGQTAGPVLGEADEVVIVDFRSSPQATTALLSGQARARRMVPYRLANHNRLLDPGLPPGPANPSVLKPQMPLWMAELELLGVSTAELQDLLARRYFREHVGLVALAPMKLTFDLQWRIALSWEGPDMNSPAFPAITRHLQTYSYSQVFSGAQAMVLRFGQRGQLTDASGRALKLANGEIPDAFVPSVTPARFPVAGRRLPRAVLDVSRPWGRHAGAATLRAFVIEWQPRIAGRAGEELIRGGDGVLELSVSVDGQRIEGGLMAGTGGVLSAPSPRVPDARLPRFRVMGTNPAPPPDVVALIDALVAEYFTAHAAQPHVALLSLNCWQITARLIFQHENGGNRHFEQRAPSTRRIRFQGASYGLQRDMPLFGPPHGYGFGQLDSPPVNQGADDGPAWSFLENIRRAVRQIFRLYGLHAFNYLSTSPAGGAAFIGLAATNPRRQRAIYQRELVRRYNGGREFAFSTGDWRINPSLHQLVHDPPPAGPLRPNARLLYANRVLGPAGTAPVSYFTGNGVPNDRVHPPFGFPWPITFGPASYGPGT